MFLNFLEAAGGDELSPVRRNAIVLNAQGVEGQQIFYSVTRGQTRQPSATAKPREGGECASKDGKPQERDAAEDAFLSALVVLDAQFATATNKLVANPRF